MYYSKFSTPRNTNKFSNSFNWSYLPDKGEKKNKNYSEKAERKLRKMQ